MLRRVRSLNLRRTVHIPEGPNSAAFITLALRMMKKTTYSANMDLLAKIITNLVLAMFLVLLLMGLGDNSREWEPVMIRILILPIVGIAWGYHPSYYVVSPRTLGIKRPFGSINIPIDLC